MTIIQDDEVYLPVNSVQSLPLSDNRIPKKWRDKLGYRSIPLGMITKNSVEVFREIDDRVFSVILSGPNTGLQIGIVEVFGSTAGYTATSGARSLYMVPRISKTSAHKKLRREFGVTTPPPKQLLDHWYIFKELYASPEFDENWECEILFLTKKWNDHFHDETPAWLKFHSYVQDKGWEHSELGRRKIIMDVVWQQTSILLTNKGLKPDPYVVDTLRHLIFVSLGGISGYRPVNGDDFSGPINKIQTIYSDIYQLEQIPTIMRPYNLSLAENKPVYYSMQNPTLLSSTPNFRNLSSTIEDMRELINIKNYVFGMDYGNLKVDYVRFNDLINKIQFDYYHGDMYAYGQNIRPTKEIPIVDKDFLYSPSQKHTHSDFAEHGAFIRGSIRISKKDSLNSSSQVSET